MKYIVFTLMMMGCFGTTSIVLAQQSTIDQNGRTGSIATQSASPESMTEQNQRPAETRADDRDIPGEQRKSQTDIILPAAIDELRDELYNSASVPEVVAEVEALKTVVAELRVAQEKLAAENEILRKQLNSCCNAGAQGLTAQDAYLLQNAPNPFQMTTKLEYFVPEHVGRAQLEIRDLKGVTLQSFEIENGLGDLQLDAAQWPAGTYVYTLVVEEEIVDSKVMIIK